MSALDNIFSPAFLFKSSNSSAIAPPLNLPKRFVSLIIRATISLPVNRCCSSMAAWSLLRVLIKLLADSSNETRSFNSVSIFVRLALIAPALSNRPFQISCVDPTLPAVQKAISLLSAAAAISALNLASRASCSSLVPSFICIAYSWNEPATGPNALIASI